MICQRLSRPGVKRHAEISACDQYRYALRRTWDATRPAAMFVGLNPSTADRELDDPTICCCVRIAEHAGYGGLLVANLFAHRATDPAALRTVQDPIGPENDRRLVELAHEARVVVPAWGGGGGYRERDRHVLALLREVGTPLQCLGTTQSGAPRHPLRLHARTALAPFDA